MVVNTCVTSLGYTLQIYIYFLNIKHLGQKKFFFFSLDVRYWYMGIAVEMGAEATF
jgi:hypothetical protein